MPFMFIEKYLIQSTLTPLILIVHVSFLFVLDKQFRYSVIFTKEIT
jgi:hypothetical protein